jgi:hypothetical protein
LISCGGARYCQRAGYPGRYTIFTELV